MAFTVQRRSVIGTAMAVGVLGALALAPAQAQETSKLRVIFSIPPAPFLLPYYVAQDEGWYKKWGLETEEKTVSGDPNALRAMIAGEGDVTMIGPNTVIDAIVKGGPIKAFASFQPITDYQVITRADGGSLKELTDKSWAVFSPSGMTVEIPKMLLRKNGLDATKPQYLPVGGMSARMQAVVAKKVDVTMVDTFFAALAKKQGLVTVASIAKEFPNLGYGYAVATMQSLADPKMKKALTIFTRGGIEGVRLIAKDPDKAAAIMKKRLPDVDLDLIKEVLVELNATKVWGINGGIERQITEFSTKTFFDLGAISGAPPYETIVDTSIVDAVIKEIGRM